MSQEREQADLVSYSRGEYLFREGERGGDLYIIESGHVEILRKHAGQEVKLADMNAGEILGIMTCLSNEPRMASAKARTPVKARKISHTRIRDQITRMPQWFNVVLKEFAIRLNQMNQSYSQTSIKIKELERNQLSALYTAVQMTSAIPALTKHVARKIGDDTFVVMDDLFSLLEMTLDQPKERLEKIFTAILAAGLAKVEVNNDTKSVVLQPSSLKGIAGFHQFLKEVQAGKMKRLLSLRFSNKESRILMGLCKVAKTMYADAKEACELSHESIVEYFQKKPGVELDLDMLKVAEEHKLLKVKGTGEDCSVIFVPLKLEKTVRSLEAVRRIKLLDESVENPSVAV